MNSPTEQGKPDPIWGVVELSLGFGADSRPGRITFHKGYAKVVLNSAPDEAQTLHRRQILGESRAPESVGNGTIFLPTKESPAGVRLEAEPRHIEALLTWLPDSDLLTDILGVEVALPRRAFPRGVLYGLIGKNYTEGMPGCGLACLDGSPGNSGDVLFQFAQKASVLDDKGKKEQEHTERWLALMHAYTQARTAGKLPWPLPLNIPPKALKQNKEATATLPAKVPKNRQGELTDGALDLYGIGAVLSWGDKMVFWPRDIVFEFFLPKAGKTKKSPIVIKAPYGGPPFWTLLEREHATAFVDWVAPAKKRQDNPELDSPWFRYQDAARR